MDTSIQDEPDRITFAHTLYFLWQTKKKIQNLPLYPKVIYYLYPDFPPYHSGNLWPCKKSPQI